MVGKVSGGIRILGEKVYSFVAGLTRIGETVCARSLRNVEGSPLSQNVKLRCQELKTPLVGGGLLGGGFVLW